MRALSHLAPLALLLACGGGDGSTSGPAGSSGPAGPTGPTGTDGRPAGGGWIVTRAEGFEGDAPAGTFAPDTVPDDGPFADAGAFWTARGVRPPAAFRASAPYGEGGWLTVESYTRRPGEDLSRFVRIVPDPADPGNHVLRLASPAHTDATVLRPTAPLPPRYRVSLRVGFAEFGDGRPGLNGHAAEVDAGPWWPDASANQQNGFYWLAILDHLPRPHNNTWIHHHRKVVVDSDNHFPPWMEVWDGRRFAASGERPVMMIALDGGRPGDERTGPPFLSWSAGAWQPSGAIRAVDAYLPGTWYRATVERDGPRYTLEISGRFRHGGERTYRATVDAAARCVFHYPVDAAEAAAAAPCADEGAFPDTGGQARWPADGAWPDWFAFGDPHANYYEGHVLYDDVVLEVPAG